MQFNSEDLHIPIGALAKGSIQFEHVDTESDIHEIQKMFTQFQVQFSQYDFELHFWHHEAQIVYQRKNEVVHNTPEVQQHLDSLERERRAYRQYLNGEISRDDWSRIAFPGAWEDK